MNDFETINKPEPRPVPAVKPSSGGQSKGCFYGCLGASAVFFVFAGMITVLMLSGDSTPDALFSSTDPADYSNITEQVVRSGDSSAKVAVIRVNGIIHSGAQFGDASPADALIQQIRKAKADDNVKAVLLDMNTPGGEVTATDEIHHELQLLRERGVYTLTCMRSVAASGGYYLAAGTDYIMANRLTMTGSIGVVIGGYNYHGLFERFGVHSEVYKSGKLKDVLNMGRKREAYEVEMIQDMIDESFLEFAKIVADGRKDLELAQVQTGPIGDAGIFSGRRAMELGLVDELGYIDDAMSRIAELAKLKNPRFVRYGVHVSLSRLLLSMRSDPSAFLRKSLLSEAAAIKPGHLYYLSPVGR